MTDRAKDRLKEISEEFCGCCTVGPDDVLPLLQKAFELGRTDENNEAAGIAEKRCQCPHHISIAYEIRSRLSGEDKK